MTRHVADKRAVQSQRPLRFLEIEKRTGEEGTHPATRAIHSRQADSSMTRRIAEFLRIERGRTA
jgi:hypothetical protein